MSKANRPPRSNPTDLNHYFTTGNLTADPLLKTLTSGTSVCEMRIANNGLGRGDRQAVGYLDVTVYGKSAETCHRYLRKGRAITAYERLEWREWTQDDGQHRSAIDLIANTVKFLNGRDASETPDEPAAVTSDPDDIPILEPCRRAKESPVLLGAHRTGLSRRTSSCGQSLLPTEARASRNVMVPWFAQDFLIVLVDSNLDGAYGGACEPVGGACQAD